MPTAPGWYPNPDDASTLRWWDGESWASVVSPPIFDTGGTADEAETTAPQTLPPLPPPPPPPPGMVESPPAQEPEASSSTVDEHPPPAPEHRPPPPTGLPPVPTERGREAEQHLPPPPERGPAAPPDEITATEAPTQPFPAPPPQHGLPQATGGFDDAPTAQSSLPPLRPPQGGFRMPPAGMPPGGMAPQQGGPPPSGGYPVPPGAPSPPPLPWHPAPIRPPSAWTSARLPLVLGGAALVVAVAAAAFLVLRSDPPSLTFAGESIAEPEATLAGAEDKLVAIVEERHGATNDDSRCYFSLPDDETTDVNDYVRCGPVLFVDGDPDEPYLSFPLEETAGDGDDVQLVTADQPEDREPSALDATEVLRRPDDVEAPEGSGGLEAPEPIRAEPGLVEVRSVDDLELEDPGASAQIVAWGQAYDLVGIGQPERFGHGDDARRPAEGEMFVAAEIEPDLGEGFAVDAPDVAIQIGEDAPTAAPTELTSGTLTVGLILSVPEDTDVVDLVVTEMGIEQRLSLLTGEPGDGNVSVLRRDNRDQELGASAALVFTASAPGRITESFNVTVTVPSVSLFWYFGDDGSIHPADPGRAYLVPITEWVWDPALGFGADVSLDPPAFTLVLPDGTVVPALNLAPEPDKILIAFDVPADLTTATLVVGGVYVAPDGVTLDFGASQLQAPISIPEG